MTREYASIWQSGQWIARGMFAAALLTACGQDMANTDSTTTAASDDTAAQYNALSASLQKCDDEHDACTTAAAGDATKTAACDSKAAACTTDTRGAEDNAHHNLRNGSEGCMKAHHCREDDAGANDECHPAVHHWVQQHAPVLPPCVEDFFVCLDKTGIRMSSGQLTDATKAAIGECVDTAHTCFMDAFQARRRQRHGEAGGPAAPGGHAGEGPHAAGRGAGPGDAGHGAFPGAPGHGAEAGSGHHDAEAGSGHHDGEAGRFGGFPFAGAPAHNAAGAPSHEKNEAGRDARGDQGRGRGEGGAAGSRR